MKGTVQVVGDPSWRSGRADAQPDHARLPLALAIADTTG
jgi:hypothetical protein